MSFLQYPFTQIIKSFLNSYIKESKMNLVACQMDIQMLSGYEGIQKNSKSRFLIPKENRISISCICRWSLSAWRNIRRMFTKHYRNRQVVTTSWDYYLPRKICAKALTKINVFRICPVFQNYDCHSDKYKKKLSNWVKAS